MPPIFIKQFMRQFKCPHCKAHKVPEKSLCQFHLAKARVYFQTWANKRRKEGLCIRCRRKSFKGYLRCRLHTEENRARCRAWMKIHGHGQWEKAKNQAYLTGMCAYCRPAPAWASPSVARTAS